MCAYTRFLGAESVYTYSVLMDRANVGVLAGPAWDTVDRATV